MFAICICIFVSAECVYVCVCVCICEVFPISDSTAANEINIFHPYFFKRISEREESGEDAKTPSPVSVSVSWG